MENPFLVELGTEELPPKSLKQLGEAFAANFMAELKRHDLHYGEIIWYASPRRLALKVTGLCASQPNRETIKRGPALSHAFDAEGKPTTAAKGWAKGCGITVDQAEKTQTDKGGWLTYTLKQNGQPVTELLCEMTQHALAKLPISKPMRWADKSSEFIRPVHTLTLLYGDTLIPCTVLGIDSARTLFGHRFMGKQKIHIKHADEYPEILEKQGKVIADYQKRKSLIKKHVEAEAKKLHGYADISENLLDEVTSLVEWPIVLVARFEEKFLNVPAEALVSTMKGDQKYFPVYDKNNHLMPYFIFVSNIDSPHPEWIISGNEKVVRPRLADAEFFYQTDLKTRLDARLPQLETLLFQQKLGSLRDKAERISMLAGSIAKSIHADPALSKRAGLLAKCDLVSHVAFEFPETQGILGKYLAEHDKEPAEVAKAIQEHYLPRFAGDAIPGTLIAAAVAIADKMDTLVGIFGVGLLPKGDKDPFALRRAALGVLRIIVEKELPLDLNALAIEAAALYGNKLTNKNVVQDTVAFMQGRFRAWYLDEGYDNDTIQAVLATHPTKPMDFDARVKAVSHFRTLETATALSAANKRVSNILSKVQEPVPDHINTALLEPGPENNLAHQLTALMKTLTPYFAKNDYKHILTELASLRHPIDVFFDSVMVMVDDPKIRMNRLALLKQLQNMFLRVADISLLQS